MNIKIRNYQAGSFLLEQEPKRWDVIAILDSAASHTDFVASHSCRHLYLRFDDVVSDAMGKRSPTTEDVVAALEFARDSQNLLVCCRAGQSRSVAIALVICFHRLGPTCAYDLLNPKRHIPNRMIVELGARVIDDPNLLTTFQIWQSDNVNVKLSDYLDDIEREFDELEGQGARNRITNS